MSVFTCPYCRTSLKAPDDAEGQLVDCPACNQAIEVPQRKITEADRAIAASRMIVTTTGFIANRQTEKYLGVVSAEVIYGANVLRDIMASARDFVGGRVPAYETVVRDARQEAIQTLREKAARLDADALLGLSVDCEILGQQNGMLMITALATAVKLSEKHHNQSALITATPCQALNG